MSKDSIVHKSYFAEAFDNPDKLIKNAKNSLKDVDFDTMVGTGLSGSLVVPILARAFGCKFAIIRKNTENNHDHMSFVGEIGHKWIFVDDFIASGSTLHRVTEAVNRVVTQEYTPFECERVGAYLYSTDRYGSSGPGLYRDESFLKNNYRY